VKMNKQPIQLDHKKQKWRLRDVALLVAVIAAVLIVIFFAIDGIHTMQAYMGVS